VGTALGPAGQARDAGGFLRPVRRHWGVCLGERALDSRLLTPERPCQAERCWVGEWKGLGGKRAAAVVALDESQGRDWCFLDCPHNRASAVVERLLMQVDKAKKLIKENNGRVWIRLLNRNLARYAAMYGTIEPYTPAQVLATLSGTQKGLYARMYEQWPVPAKKHSTIKVIVKVECYGVADKLRIPRPIQPRHPAFRAFMARWFKPMEKRLGYSRFDDHYPWLAKGKDQQELAELFLLKWSRFRRPVALSLDMSKFDGHVSAPLLDAENGFYRKVAPYPEFYQRLSSTNHGTFDGYSYKVRGTRASGDQQTGLGNSLLMYSMCKVVFRKSECFVNGDDTVVILEEEDLLAAADIRAAFAPFGMEAKIESIDRDPYEVSWCQCRIMPSSPPVWQRLPDRVLSSVMRNTRYGRKDTFERMKSVLTGELSLATGNKHMTKILSNLVGKLWSYKTSKDETAQRQRYQTLRPTKNKIVIPDRVYEWWFQRHSGWDAQAIERVTRWSREWTVPSGPFSESAQTLECQTISGELTGVAYPLGGPKLWNAIPAKFQC